MEVLEGSLKSPVHQHAPEVQNPKVDVLFVMGVR